MGASDTHTPKPAAPRCPAGGKGKVRRAVDFVVRYVLPSGISVGLILWFFHKVDFHKVMEVIREGCNLWWIAAMMVVTVLNMCCRGVRWGIQLRGVGIKRLPPVAECASIWGAYALNLLFPRLGEAWRCLYISRRQHCPFTTVLGTDIGDRTSDLLCVFVFIGLGLIFTHEQLVHFMDHYAVGRFIKDAFSNVWVWSGLAVAVIVYIILIKYFDRYRWVCEMRRGLTNVWVGWAILFRMPQLGLYLWLTLGIWGCYFLETYVCLFAFPFTKEWMMQPELAWGLRPGLIMMVFSVCSTAIPSNGGLGPWTISITYALVLFGLPQTQAAAFSLLVWACQQGIIVVMGVVTLIYISVKREKERRAAATSSTPSPKA